MKWIKKLVSRMTEVELLCGSIMLDARYPISLAAPSESRMGKIISEHVLVSTIVDLLVVNVLMCY